MSLKKLLPLAVIVGALLAVFAASASAATVVNGDFETGDLSGWTLLQDSGGAGTFQTYSGTALDPLPAAHGTSTAFSSQGFISSGVIYQDVSLEPGMSHVLNLNYWSDNEDSDWVAPSEGTFNLDGISNATQYGEIDVLKAGADPWTADPAEILAKIYAPQSGDPMTLDWTAGSADLSAFAGQTVRIRAVFTVTNAPVLLGLDDVSITSTPLAAPTIAWVGANPNYYRIGKKLGFSTWYSVSRTSTVTATFTQSAPGKKSGGKCVAPTRKNAKAKSCTRLVTLPGSLTYKGGAGFNKFDFDGTLNGKALPAGKYTITLTAQSADGKLSGPASAKFVALPKRK